MKVSVAARDGNYLYQATASEGEVSQALLSSYAEFAATLGLAAVDVDPGEIERKAEDLMGVKDVKSIITPKVLAKLTTIAIDAKQHRPAFAPTAQAASPVREGEPCSFSFSLTPKPILKLAEHDPIDIAIEIPAVTEQDVDQEILYIASAYLARSDDGESPTENASFEIDDEWVRKNAPWFKDYEGMRRIVRKNLEETTEASIENRRRSATAKELAKHLVGEIDNGSYRETVENLRAGLLEQLKQSGVTWDEFVAGQGGEDAVGMALLVQAREILTQGYALDALFAQQKLVLTQDDIDKACQAMNPGQPTRDTYEAAKRMGRMHTLMETAERFKANDWLVDHSNVTVIRAEEETEET